MRYFRLILFFLSVMQGCTSPKKETQVDICIYGGNAAGVIAAYTAAKMNMKVLGGLTSGGLGYTDIGNKYAITGLSLDFYRRVGKHYGKLEQWIFEPHVAENILKEYIREAKVQVIYGHRLSGVEKAGGKIMSITVSGEGSRKINAGIFLDCSYEGDLMAKAGVSYTVGREANSQYNETYNGVQVMKGHQFPDGIDPYKVPGDSSSGLVWGVSNAALDTTGSGDKKVQAYNFRICLSNDTANRIPITKPDNYDPARYELLLRYLQHKVPGDLWGFLKFDLMPNHKTDINNNGPISTDMIGMNHNYPEADYATRKKIQQAHEDYTKGLLYFIGHDERMPEHLRNQMLQWGYPKDEYTDNNHWSPQMYVREARRMIGAYVMTQHNCQGREVVDDGIGLAAYTMDSHNCQRLVVNGMVKNEGNVEIGGFGPYPISYRSIIPKATECTNLLVPVCLSASHIAYGSIRMEPVFMVLGQSAAIAATLAIKEKKAVQDVDVKAIQSLLKGEIHEVNVDNDDSANIQITGDWSRRERGAYGRSMLIDSSKGAAPKSIRFIPVLPQSGMYDVYTYIPKLPGMSSVIPVSMFDGTALTPVNIKAADIKIEGQTSGEWIHLGKHRLPTGKNVYVEISNKGADGFVFADAVLFIPE
jgi:hypothetical protein